MVVSLRSPHPTNISARVSS